MHIIYWLLGLFCCFVTVSGNPAGQNSLVDCSYICNPENGLQLSCSLRCPGYSGKQQSATSGESHESHFPTTALIASLVSVCLVAAVIGVIVYKFRAQICNRFQLNSLCTKSYPINATTAENNTLAKLAGRNNEHEMELLSNGDSTI